MQVAGCLTLKDNHFISTCHENVRTYKYGLNLVQAKRNSVLPTHFSVFVKNTKFLLVILRFVIAAVCRKTNGEVNISNKHTTVVVWIYDGV